MRFWDTSAIVPLCVQEQHSLSMKRILVSDSAIVVWWATQTECLSALQRRRREATLDQAGERDARRVLQTLAKSWTEILPSRSVRQVAERLLAVHSLTAPDAFQLSAALAFCRGETDGIGFVCFDARLREAAHKEGFEILPAQAL